jgi:prepilin-type N-terminal cleavage/methylation domain-containing protein
MTPSRHRHEDGFTLIEVLVAALIMVVGMMGLAAVLIGADNQATAAVTESQLINVADQQIDLVRLDVAQDGFSALAMSAVPTAAALPSGTPALRLSTFTDPDRWVTAGTVGGSSNAVCFQIQANYDVGTSSSPPVGFYPWSNCQSTGAEPLAVPTASTSGALVTVATQGSGTWTAGSWPPPACAAASAAALSSTVVSPCTITLAAGLQAVVYTFVSYTYSTDADTYSACSVGMTGQSCPTLTTGTVTGCPSTGFPTTTSGSTPCGDSRRVTVAVLPVQTRSLSRQTPVYISSVFTDPAPSTGQASALGLQVQ